MRAFVLILCSVGLMACSQDADQGDPAPIPPAPQAEQPTPASAGDSAQASQPKIESIGVVGRQSVWTAVYPGPDGELWTDDDLREERRITVPVNQPVKITLKSEDVIHCLFIPALRAKKDAVPGRLNQLDIQSSSTGTFDFLCTEYCGVNHSQMIGELHVLDPDAFAVHLQTLGEVSP